MQPTPLSKALIITLLFSFSFISQLTYADENKEQQYSHVYIFGDSLSDTGNLASVIGNFPNPPYFNNRVTNGLVAVETLAAKLGHVANASLHLLGLNNGDNYAVASADAVGYDPVDLYTQILSFQANHNFVAPADALYVVFIGGNDIRTARNMADTEAAKALVLAAKDEVKNAIQALGAIGAKSFLVVNSGDISLTPETQLIAAATNNPAVIEYTHQLSKLYKKSMHKMVKNLERHSNLKIAEFNLFKFFGKVVKNADELGFTNNSNACFSSATGTFHPDCQFGLNIGEFVFFDELHPTARVHEMVGNAMYKALKEKKHHKHKHVSHHH